MDNSLWALSPSFIAYGVNPEISVSLPLPRGSDIFQREEKKFSLYGDLNRRRKRTVREEEE
ncbi:hypothetical protein TIFTF001_048031 [Ficus carica]|uniref:Uncharacterized protein n=1 Tax=Ficus carica TaxID=3494 RepID=A0AA87Z6U0_FICCA|nr:hypothetical protein TIFTF001_048031 [Ficus carica]